MSYRLSQLSPQASTRVTKMRMAIRGPWSEMPQQFQDVQFWRSWLEFDSDEEELGRARRVNWNALIGMALMVGISASFWTGVGFVAARILR
jgi:hypothetical protein